MFRPAKVAVLATLFAAAPFGSALAQSATPEDALRPRSATRLGAGVQTPALDAAAADPLTPEQLALRLADLYDRTADLLRAEARGDEREYVEILEGLVIDARFLSTATGVVGQPRFREAYAVVMTEYEQYYDAPALDRGEIYAFREGLFQATESVEGPLLEDVSLPEDLGPNVAIIPMPMNRLVESALNYLRRANGHTSRIRTRADTYFPMIERIMADEGVPDELKYLAVVESALNPRARSHAAAAGMWQFIRATGAAYQLRVTDDRDDRLDPEQSTRAAARHLRDLHERFNGDWHLALAGYNCNPLRVERAVRDAEARLGRRATFWDIYDDIPRETRNYVPMFIATALIMSNPSSFGLPAHDPGPRYVYDEVPIEVGTSLSAVAMAAGTTVDAIRALNPSFRRDRVPDVSSGSLRMVRIPVGAYASNERELDRLAPATSSRNAMYAARTVRYGSRADFPLAVTDADTRYASASPGRTTRRSEDRPARRATPPREEPAPTVIAVAERTTEEAGPDEASAETPAEPRAEEPRPTRRREPARPTTHRVQRGDNLSAIAGRYGVSVRQIREWNELSGDNIRPGQRLRISADASGARAAAARSRGPSVTTHRVRPGENLSAIARRYGVTVRQIRGWNSSLSGDTIRPGQRIRIERPRSVG